PRATLFPCTTLFRSSWLRPFEVRAEEGTQGSIWRERFSRLPTLLPFIVLMVALLGSMYSGLASPSEAAALAVVVTLGIMAIERRSEEHTSELQSREN